MRRKCDRVSEAILIAMACLSPWAFGAEEAWAEGALYLAIAVAALLGAVSGLGADRARYLVCAPSLALAGLVLLALGQAAPLSEGVLRRVAPSTAALRGGLAPAAPVRVLGDPGPPVAAPAPAISQHAEMTVDVAARLAAAWVLFQVVLGLEGGHASLRRFGLALAANGALLALFSLIQMLSWNGKIYWYREVRAVGNAGPFITHNHLAAYLNLCLGFALSFLIISSDGRGDRRPQVGGLRLAAAYATGMIAVGVIASLSRSGFLGMLAASVVTFAVLKPVSLSPRVGLGVAVTLGLGAVLMVSVGVFDAYERLTTILKAESYTDRFAIWAGALRAWSAYPVFGVGLGGFTFGTMRFFPPGDACFFEHAENEYIEALTEGGVVGLVLVLLALVSVLRLGRRALAASAGQWRRAPVLGALFGVVTMATQCLSDFPMHAPAVAVTAVILAAHLCRVGLEARGKVTAAAPVPPWRWVGSALAGVTAVAVSLVALVHGVGMARAEAALAGGGIPPAGAVIPTAGPRKNTMSQLELARAHLERALRYRPDWAEGHARLGLTLLSEYRAAVLGMLGGQVADPVLAEGMADPLRLHAVVHSAKPEEITAAGGVLGQEAVVRYLVPAARSFLEARRCCPNWGLAHAELASLDYLLPGGEPAPVHARRALRLGGPDAWAFGLAARAAAQSGDLDLAALCWRREIETREEDWAWVADQAAAVLPPDRILDRVLPGGRFALWFADRLYGAPAARPTRDKFLRTALERLPHDQGLPEADRLHYEAQALARLGEVEPAKSRMMDALGLEPRRVGWRKELVEWLIGWKRPDEAHELALVGWRLAPGDPNARLVVELAVEAMSGGPPPSADRGLR